MIGKTKDIIKWLLCQDDEKQYEILEYKEKRSLDSNSYAWVLIVKIADILRKNKNDVYLSMLKDYGQSAIIKISSVIKPNEYFKYYELVNIKDDYSYYKVFKGSSEFDSKEMSIFIDGIITEAQDLGIETKTPQEIANLKDLWNKV